MAAFKKSQMGGAGPYTDNDMIGKPMRGIDESGNPTEKPKSIAKPLGIDEASGGGPIVGDNGGYQPVKSGGSKRYEPL
jgi:hypothetical protein